MSSLAWLESGLNNINPLLHTTKFFTQEAIGSLQLPTTLEQPAKVSRCRLWTEVGLTLLRACPIFFVTSCDFALGSGFRGDEHARTMRDKKSPSAKSGAKLQNKCPITLDSFRKNAKNLHFFTKSGKIAPKSAGN